MPVNKPLRAVTMPFLMTGSNHVAYINEWVWSVMGVVCVDANGFGGCLD
jgi:hypothetical protein